MENSVDIPQLNVLNDQSGSYQVKEERKEQKIYYVVHQNNHEIYRSRATEALVEYPWKNFVTKGDDWWLLYVENIFVAEEQPYQKKMRLVHNGQEKDFFDVFALHKIDDKIFYFFQDKKEQKVSYYLAGKIYQTNFQRIIHDECCESGVYNIRIADDGRLAF